MPVKEYENPDALSGPSSSCFPHFGHMQEKKYPAILIMVKYPIHQVSAFQGRNSRISGTVFPLTGKDVNPVYF